MGAAESEEAALEAEGEAVSATATPVVLATMMEIPADLGTEVTAVSEEAMKEDLSTTTTVVVVLVEVVDSVTIETASEIPTSADPPIQGLGEATLVVLATLAPLSGVTAISGLVVVADLEAEIVIEMAEISGRDEEGDSAVAPVLDKETGNVLLVISAISPQGMNAKIVTNPNPQAPVIPEADSAGTDMVQKARTILDPVMDLDLAAAVVVATPNQGTGNVPHVISVTLPPEMNAKIVTNPNPQAPVIPEADSAGTDMVQKARTILDPVMDLDLAAAVVVATPNQGTGNVPHVISVTLLPEMNVKIVTNLNLPALVILAETGLALVQDLAQEVEVEADLDLEAEAVDSAPTLVVAVVMTSPLPEASVPQKEVSDREEEVVVSVREEEVVVSAPREEEVVSAREEEVVSAREEEVVSAREEEVVSAPRGVVLAPRMEVSAQEEEGASVILAEAASVDQAVVAGVLGQLEVPVENVAVSAMMAELPMAPTAGGELLGLVTGLAFVVRKTSPEGKIVSNVKHRRMMIAKWSLAPKDRLAL